MGHRCDPFLVNLKSNTMKNTRTEIVIIFEIAMDFYENLFIYNKL